VFGQHRTSAAKSAPGSVCTCVENLTHTGIGSPDRPSRNKSLHRLWYPNSKMDVSYKYLLANSLYYIQNIFKFFRRPSNSVYQRPSFEGMYKLTYLAIKACDWVTLGRIRAIQCTWENAINSSPGLSNFKIESICMSVESATWLLKIHKRKTFASVSAFQRSIRNSCPLAWQVNLGLDHPSVEVSTHTQQVGLIWMSH
jgi:hypothetical protein